jgi:hypothetical protein
LLSANNNDHELIFKLRPLESNLKKVLPLSISFLFAVFFSLTDMTSILRRTAILASKRPVLNLFVRPISTTRKPNYAFAFDIDGVLIKVIKLSEFAR